MSPAHLNPAADPLALAVLVALLAGTVGGAAVVRRTSATSQTITGVALLGLSITWIVVNGPYEGQVLWVPAPGHGLTVGDLLAVPALAVAAALLLARRRRTVTAPSAREAVRRRRLALLG